MQRSGRVCAVLLGVLLAFPIAVWASSASLDLKPVAATVSKPGSRQGAAREAQRHSVLRSTGDTAANQPDNAGRSHRDVSLPTAVSLCLLALVGLVTVSRRNETTTSRTAAVQESEDGERGEVVWIHRYLRSRRWEPNPARGTENTVKLKDKAV